ncbi:hypothetical protein SKAU_G00387100 [Synaphobranchus kaupii]|uniref:Reverse transcriptase n=1 Tax=Synaphobranchus kaupii TaxID=118154 RepID=A0A9Q1IB91_SYNKA|nr:hypothetical protein SKAU_G00387100 [Synaphobranchus kaupii]
MVTEGWRGRSGEFHGLAVCQDGMKVLGVRFWRERADKANWEECLEKKAVLFLRAHREVTVERLQNHRALYKVLLEKQSREAKIEELWEGGNSGACVLGMHLLKVFWGRANRTLFSPVWGLAVDKDMVLRGVGIDAVGVDEREVASFLVSWGREEVRDEEEGVQLVDQLWREVKQGKQEDLGGIIKREEVREALSSLKNGKAPGRDGIPKEVYSAFWDIMSDDLVELFNEIGRRGEMPLSMREGIIHLLHKKGDRRGLGNWRPVTLLGADYKVLGRVLANKAKAVLGEVLSPDQTCGGTR